MSPTLSRGRLLGLWLKIGCTSFGGGPVTQYLIQEQFIYKHGLLTQEEYSTIVGMSQIAPGINLLSIAILIGRRLGGRAGVALSLLGLLAPSVAITLGMTAAYARYSHLPRVQATIGAAFAAIIGITVATNWRNIGPIFARSLKKSLWTLGATLAIFLGSPVLYAFLKPPAFLLYLLGGLCGALASRAWSKSRRGG